MAISTVTELKMLIDGEWVERVRRRVDRRAQPGHRRARGPRAEGHGGGRGPGGAARPARPSTTAAGAASWIAERVAILNKLADLIDEHTPRAGRAGVGPDRHGHQAPARLRHAVRGRQPALLRDGDPPPRRQGGRPSTAPTTPSMVRREPHRRRRPDRALELPLHDGHLEDRAGARGGQLGRAQAGQRHAPDDPQARRAGPRGRAARPACSTSSPARATRSARRSRRTRTSTW